MWEAPKRLISLFLHTVLSGKLHDWEWEESDKVVYRTPGEH